MKFRILIACLLCAALAAPAVIAQVGGFPDVPEDHPRADAIRWAGGEGLFLGFPDGNLRPDADLTRPQFVRVAERLYDSADAWSRADWAQVMYGGVPSLTGTAPATTSAPAATAGVSLRCGWPLGDPEAVLPLPDTGPPREIRFPVTPCSPPVTYRISFGGQTINLPYATAAESWTPAMAWRGGASSDFESVTVTEYRPGGPPDGRRVGTVNIPWRAVRERAAAPTATTAASLPAPPATAAPSATTTTSSTTTTTRPPAVTVPPPDPVAEVPYWERDVVVHWFHYPGSERKNDTPFIGLYVADPDGPIPLELDADGEKWSGAAFKTRIRWYSPGGGSRTWELWMVMYFTDHPGSAFSPRSFNVAADTSEVIVDIATFLADSDDDGEDERYEYRPFRSVSFVQVEPPAYGCAKSWRDNSGSRRIRIPHWQDWHYLSYSRVFGRLDCHPSEWAEWWGVRATYREAASE